MERKAVTVIMLTILLTSTLAWAYNVQPAGAGIIIVPDDYPTIQQAVDAASSGDTVYVRAGTYYEGVVVTNPLSLVGEDRETTVIDGSGWTSAVRSVNVDCVNVTGFAVRGSVNYPFAGIRIGGRNCNVSGNNVANCYYGIDLESYGDNVITVNDVTSNHFGILLAGSHNNDVAENTVVNNNYGIRAYGSDRNRIVENSVVAYDVANDFFGISLTTEADMNILSRNHVTNNRHGIYIDSSYQDWHNFNRVVENTITNSEVGIAVYYSGYNSLVANNITANNCGVSLYGSSCANNSLVGNNIAYNQEGIRAAFGCRENRVYHNNFIYNTNQVHDDNAWWTNVWDNGYPSGGNYWSDYSGTDVDHDGIGDLPYNVSDDEKDNYPLINPRNIVYPWGDDDSDDVLNYLDVPGLAIGTWQCTRRILGFDFSLAWSTNNTQIDYGLMSALYESWGINMPEIRQHMTFAVLDSDSLIRALYWLQTNVPYLITQDFVDSLTRHLCSDGHFRLLLFAHYDLDVEETLNYLLRIQKLATSPDWRSGVTALSYLCNMFDIEIYQLEGVDSVQASLQFDWTDIAKAVELAKLGMADLSALVGAVVDVVTMTLLVLGGVTVAPELMLLHVSKAVVKTFKFILDLLIFARADPKTLDWIKTILVAVDPPGEKLVLQLRDPVSGTLVLGYDSTSGADIGAFPYGIYVSEDDSALMMLARDYVQYNLTVTRNSTGSSLPYMMIVWDCEENKTVTTGGFLESQQETSSNIRIESDVLTMPYLQVHANFSSLTPNVGEQVEVNITVTDNIGSPVDGLIVASHLNNERTFAEDLGEGRYQTQLDTSGMLGFYNVTIYTANPPSGFLQGMSSYPLMVGTSDMVITDSTCAKTVIGQGFLGAINLTVENAGNIVEPFVVSLYANETCILRQGIAGLAEGNLATLQLTLRTTRLDKGNHSIIAVIDPLIGEANVLDNNRTVGWIIVAMPGDITGPNGWPDGKVDQMDFSDVARLFGVVYPDPRCNPNYDIICDLIIDIKDIYNVAKRFGQIDP